MATDPTLARTLRGIELAGTKSLRKKGDLWLVPSASGNGTYVVDPRDNTCTCPDHEEHQVRCKHSYAVEYKLTHETDSSGATIVTEEIKVTRKTYTQDWPNYNAALTTERKVVPELLRSLVDGLHVEPKQRKRGTQPMPLREVVYAGLMRTFYGLSARRAEGDLKLLEQRGLLTKVPAYNTILRYMALPEVTTKLEVLLAESARPLTVLEDPDTFSYGADATGFSTSILGRYFEDKHGKRSEDGKPIATKRRKYIKAHAMCGTRTHVVTGLIVTDGSANDAPYLPALLDATKRIGFRVDTVVADKGYLSDANYRAIEAAGAAGYIPFKVNSTGQGSPIVQKMYGLYVYKRPEFLAAYHQRSNVETVFSMVKRRFGESLLSKDETPQKNELLCKFICHNACVLVKSIHTLGLAPEFWPTSVREGVAS